MNELLEQALDYINKGFYVVPLHCYGKHMFKAKGFRLPSKNRDVIEWWWKRVPRANIGLPTSLRSNGLIIVDIDIKDGVDGRTSIKVLENEYGIVLPKTSVVKTGTGGFHYYYKNTTGIRLWGGKNVLPGIDIRAENAHVVAPPSIHQNRHKYEWVIGGPEEMAEVDDGLYSLIKMIKRNNAEEDIHENKD